MNDTFHKIRRLPPYVFEEVDKLKACLRARDIDIIDLGMGNPDLPAPQHVVDKFCETATKPRTNRYSSSRGIPGLRKAMAGYYDRRFGGVNRSIEAHSPEQYLGGIGRAVRHSVPPPIAMVTCYPANPTAQTADLDFYKQAVAFAKKHEMFVLSDMAYSEIYFEGDPPPSVLQVDGATDVAVEVNTLSKTYSMAGFRVGFALGKRTADRSASADEIVFGLWRLYAGAGGGGGGVERPAGVRRGNARDLSSTARRAD